MSRLYMITPQISECPLEEIQTPDDFNFKCPYCHKNLSSRQNLKEHINIHTGKKPFECTEPGCGKRFRQGSLLSIHRRIHKEIKRGLEHNKPLLKLPTYPKLTTLISRTSHNVHVSLQNFEKKNWLEKIEKFDFIKSELSKL